MNYNETNSHFTKDFTKLKSKYRSLQDDFNKLKEFIGYRLRQPRTSKDKHTTILREDDGICIIKTRMASSTVKGSPFRVVYAYFEEIEKVEFIEIFFKGTKEREDTKRWQEYIEQLKQLDRL